MKSHLKTQHIIALIITMQIIFSGLLFLVLRSNPALLSSENSTHLEGQLRDILIVKPEIIVESLTGYQKKQEQAMVDTMKKTIHEKTDLLENDPASPILGNPNGDVTIVEFFDYQCGHCRNADAILEKLVKEDKKLRVVFKEYPILSAASEFLTKASLAVFQIDPKKYVGFHKALMTQKIENEESIYTIARGMNISIEALKIGISSAKVQDVINANRNLGMQIGLRGTPAFIINGEFVNGALDYASLKQLIKKARGMKGEVVEEKAESDEPQESEEPNLSDEEKENMTSIPD